jgi:CTP synthase
LEDSYASVIEALHHAGAHHNVKPVLHWIETTRIENGTWSVEDALRGMDGVIVPGGFGSRGAEGKIKVIEYARTHNVPYLGLCYGLQLATIEYARNACGLENANTTENNPQTPHPVIDILPEKKSLAEMGGTLRLGGHDVLILPNTKASAMFGTKARLRFRHRFEVNPAYVERLESKGLVFSGRAPNQPIMQILELPHHRFFMATQAHPELTSKLEKPCPFFDGFVAACASTKEGSSRILELKNA